ncbi:MAG: hypothetical protein OK422_06355 [Thaumarchaeota archaeon]|nr:hypothetical protein [Nitrososphaerota archaeon]
MLASIMMIGVTLGFGGYVTNTAISQFNLAQNADAFAASSQEASVGKLVSLIYSTSTPSQSCPLYGGYNEGNVLILTFYDYGTTTFSPGEVFVNLTLYGGSGYGKIAPNAMTTFTLTLPTCAHPSGQIILLVDTSGDEVQFET